MHFGVDEAGKGPVLGSMWAAAVVVPDDDVLPDDVDDSKRVQPARREELAAALRADDRVRLGVAEITPDRIDAPETDMNTLTVCAHAEALSDAGVDGLAGYVDAGDTSEDRFARRVTDHCPCEVDVTAEHGADETYPVVAAASIVAKVARDDQMTRLGEEYGSVGSGYPSDPTTREFLADYVADTGELPPFARASWSTCADVLAAHEQAGLGDF
ncbi:ribonuclease HII [Haloarchaeobius amylolyticus]|uniref:ribonuclease HII n=1 Tax=Haloarchaeobius amylolyticus TaxID=1198296 RepID=UPI002270D48A|nr:ribonuclease HII [Haloarchaeobius amylolyticus]